MKIFLLITTMLFGTSIQAIEISAGKIISYPLFASKFVVARNVHVWLPENYDVSKTYKTLYMHDGQMLFDASITWNKQEWNVDGVAAKLMAENKVEPFIVVAIENINELRHAEYFPQKAANYLSENDRHSDHGFNQQEFKGDNYLKFIVKELIPFIREHYSVSSKAEDTLMAGSSMGGLISMYAVAEYPAVFGGAACISTHWPGIQPKDTFPIAQAIRDYMKAQLPLAGKHRFYFDHGSETLDAFYAEPQKLVDNIMRAKGYSEADWMTRTFPGDAHDEISWQKRLDMPLLFLFGKK